MPVTFVLGRAGSGKTRHCVDGVLDDLAREDRTRRAVLLVPEQASFQMERTLAMRSAGGGYWRAEVLSFSRLARRLLGALGDAPDELTGAARNMALRAVVGRLTTPLDAYGGEPAAGFYDQLGGVVESLLREGATAAALSETAARVGDPLTQARLRDVARVYGEYLAWLGPRRADTGQRLALLRRRLHEAEWLHGARIWVDGFAGFTGEELATLTALAGVADHITITLLLDAGSAAVARAAAGAAVADADALSLFGRTEETYLQLRADFVAAGVKLAPEVRLTPARAPRFVAAPDLARLEAAFAAGSGSAGVAASGEVRIVECDAPLDELREAARDIHRRIAASAGALHYRDFAVITRDIEPLTESIAEVFDEFGIPYFLDRRRPLRAHPLYRLVAALFEARLTDCSGAALSRLLRTGLLALDRADAEALDEVLAMHEVHGAALWRAESWPFARQGASAARGARMTPGLDDARRYIAQGLEPLLILGGPAQQRGKTWAAALREALEHLRVRETLEAWMLAGRNDRRWEAAEMHRLAWEGLCDTLEALDAVLGETLLSAADIARVTLGALDSVTLGLAPPMLDQVLVSSIERSRHPDIRYAWLIAFNEGVFPRPPSDDRLLSRSDRDRIAAAGLPALASQREEAFGERLLAYIACTRPTNGLTISYSRADATGEPLLPSPLLAIVRAGLPGIAIERPVRDAAPVNLVEAARGHLANLCAGTGQPRERVRRQRLRAALMDDAALRPKLAGLLRGLDYANDPPPLPTVAGSEREPVIWRGSPSELEAFIQCPFKHFAERRLRIDPQRTVRPLARDLGDVAHALLAVATRRAIASGKAMSALDDGAWKAWADEAWAAWLAQQAADEGARRPELAFAAERVRHFAEEVLIVHAERWRRGDFRPVLCEVRFDDAPEVVQRAAAAGEMLLPPLRLSTAGGRVVVLTGKIDRLDECVDDQKRTWRLVYDYKSSRWRVRGVYLTGAALQLFAYLLALHAKDDPLHLPAGVMLAPLFPEFSGDLPKYAEAWSSAEQTMYLYRPRGVIDETAAAWLDTGLVMGYSAVAGIKRNKDKAFAKVGDARPPAEIAAQLDLARRTVLYAAEGIAGGAIDVAPLVQGRRLACSACSYQALCRFERPLNRPRLAERHLPLLAGGAVEAEGDE